MEDKKPNVKYFHIFGCTRYVVRDRSYNEKLNACGEKGIFIGYSMTIKAYRVYPSSRKDILESVNVKFEESDRRIEYSVKGDTATDSVTDTSTTEPVTKVSAGTSPPE